MKHLNPALISVSAALFPPIKETGRKHFSSFPSRIGPPWTARREKATQQLTAKTPPRPRGIPEKHDLERKWFTRILKPKENNNRARQQKTSHLTTTKATLRLQKPKGMLAAHRQISSINCILPLHPITWNQFLSSHRAVKSRLDMMTGKAGCGCGG